MNRGISLVLSLFFFFVCITPAFSLVGDGEVPQTSSAQPAVTNVSSEISQPSNAMPVEAVSPNNAAEKIANLLTSIHQTLGILVIPLATVMFAILALFFIVGSLLGSKTIRKVGWVGLLACSFGLLLYVSIPFVVGLILGVGTSLAS